MDLILLRRGFQKRFDSLCPCLPLAMLFQQGLGPVFVQKPLQVGDALFLVCCSQSGHITSPGSCMEQLGAVRRCSRCSQAFIFQSLQMAGSVFYFSDLSIAGDYIEQENRPIWITPAWSKPIFNLNSCLPFQQSMIKLIFQLAPEHPKVLEKSTLELEMIQVTVPARS